MVGLGTNNYFYTQEMAPPLLRCPVGATSAEDSFRPGKRGGEGEGEGG